MPVTKSTRKAKTVTPKRTAKTLVVRMDLSRVMRELEQAGSAQTRKTYLRHGAVEPVFGVKFATLKTLLKRIGVDHELACALWNTGNFDARNLAVKIADPKQFTSADLDRWARETLWALMCGSYVAMLAVEGPHGVAKAGKWLAAKDTATRCTGWTLIGYLAQRDEDLPDTWFEQHLAKIEGTIHTAPNAERACMNQAVIGIGGRSDALRRAAIASAKRIGVVDVDHGDTACKTPDAVSSIEKLWAHSKAKGFASPSAQERKRESPRLRC